jgi:hypothetical protein
MGSNDKDDRFLHWDDLPRYIVAGMAIDVNLSSSDDLAFNSEIIEAATEGLAVPAAYHHQSGHYLTKIKGSHAICLLTVSYGA